MFKNDVGEVELFKLLVIERAPNTSLMK